MRKGIASLFLAAVLAIVLGIVAFADDSTIVASGSCGSNVTWTLDSDGLLTISGEVASMHSRATVSVISCAEIVLMGSSSGYRRATPVSRAAWATASATAWATRGSKAPGMMFSSLRSLSVMRSAMA